MCSNGQPSSYLPDHLAPCACGFGFTSRKVFACKLGFLVVVPTPHPIIPSFGNRGSRLIY